MCVLCMCTVYGVLFFPLWLKFVPGWLSISVSSWQGGRLWQIVWFGWLSAISQLASRVGEAGRVGQLCLHSVTQPYTTWPRWRSLPFEEHQLKKGVQRFLQVANTQLSLEAYICRTRTLNFLSDLFESYLFSMQIYWSNPEAQQSKGKIHFPPGYQGEMAWGVAWVYH
jgi:hypothetical protein